MAGTRTTEEVFLKGKFKHMNHLRPNPRFPDKWNVLFFPDEESLGKIKDLKKQGIMNHLKYDEVDGWCMNFSRPIERDWMGKKEALEAPKIIFTDGTPCQVRVGNGSDGILSLEVYQHKVKDRPGEYKKAARWRGARIDNFIPFNPETDYSDDEKKEIQTLREEPEQLF